MSTKPKKTQPPIDSNPEPVRTPRVFAGPCPQSPHHKSTRVYRTVGVVRYCVCDNCGTTWKQQGPAAGAEKEDGEQVPAA